MEKTQDELIAELKKKYGTITTVTVPLDPDDENLTATFYLRNPDKLTRKAISKLAQSAIPERAVIAGYKALTVAGDDPSMLEQEKNHYGLLSAESALVEILEVKRATIKKN